jgi:tRNA pseudouridine13 synthase
LKLKRLPDDFRVEELTDVNPRSGPFALYRLSKRSLGTPEAIAAIARRWRIDPRRIAFGGLKDKHAATTQCLTIDRGPRRGLKQTHFELTYLGQLDRPFSSRDIRGNRFTITLRDLDAASSAALRVGVEAVRLTGFANYYDDQRFGSLGASGQFLAQPWCAKDYQRAIWLFLCDPTDSDRPRDRRQRQAIAAGWPDWPAVLPYVDGQRRAVVEHLTRRPNDYRGALARISQTQRSLYLAAFQSHLWNLVLAELLRATCGPEQLRAVRLKPGEIVFYRALDQPQRQLLLDLRIPLPAARLAPPPGPIEHAMTRVLDRLGLTRRQLKIDYPRDSFFAKGDRAAIALPQELHCEENMDELYPGRRKTVLRFELPRGSYATMLIKRLELDIA